MTALFERLGSAFSPLAAPFLAPAYFAFLGLIPVVVLLYLLKLRRTHVVISSTLLWHKSLQDLTANAPFQRLRRNLLLLLQILILLLLVFGMARPFIKAQGTAGSDICLLIDRSASMRTREDGATTRLDLAKERALDMVDTMAGGDKMMVVTFDRSSDVLCELTDDRYHLRNAIRSIAASDAATKVRDAVLVASSLQAGAPGLRIAIVSDGKIADLAEAGSRAFDVSYLQVGETDDNAGIVAFSVREPREAGYGGGERQCLALMYNDSTLPVTTTLTLYLGDDALAVEEAAIPAKDVAEIVFAIPDIESGVLRAELDLDDALPVDNVARLVLRAGTTVKVLLVATAESPGAYFLKRVLALNPRVELSAMAPSAYAETTAAAGQYDMIVFDGFAPEELPSCTSVLFNAAPPIEGLWFDGVIENPPIIANDSEHPAMRFLNPSNVRVLKAHKLVLPDGARPLITTRGGALVADVSRGGIQTLVVAFDLADSNWPLRLSFPLFMQNLIAWAPRTSLAAETSVATGEPLTIMPVADVDTATVTLPGGGTESLKLDPTRPNYFANTARAGLYVVTCGERVEYYAANLLDPNESAITPAASLDIGRSQVAAQRKRIQQNRELWRWLVLAAVLVLSVEWWIYTRRAWL